MDNLVDIFSGDAFSSLSLSTAINLVPNQYGRVNELGLFRDEGVPTTAVLLEFDKGIVNLISSTERGSAAQKNKTGKRFAKSFLIPRMGLDDMIYPSDIQNVRAFGSLNLETVEGVVNKKLITLSRKHDITNEYLKCGALAGQVTDPDGRVLVDLFSEFDVVQKVVDFALTDSEEAISGKAEEVIGHIEDSLMGDTMSHTHALCSPGFFTALVNHKRIREAYNLYMNQQAAVSAALAATSASPIRDDVRKGFFWKGIFWEEYRGKAPFLQADGTTVMRDFVEADSARFFPVGTNDTFQSFNAPADWMETVNTKGLPKYAKVVPENGGRYVEILTESNPLPLCTRPAVLVKGTKT